MRSGPAGRPRTGRPRRTWSRLLLVLVGAAFAVVVGAVPASAHDVLIETSPAAGARVGVTPESVVLTFNQPAVAMGTQILVTGPSGQVQSGPPRLVDATVTQDVQPGAPAGPYTVAWRVTSADGHPVSGTFTFTSNRTGAGAPPPPSDPATSAPGAADGSSRGTVAGVVALVVVAGVVAVVLVRRRRS